MKKEDMGHHTSGPQTRTNFCSFAKRFLKISSYQKNDTPKALASSKTSSPLCMIFATLLDTNEGDFRG